MTPYVTPNTSRGLAAAGETGSSITKMEYHIANKADLDLLARWNHQLIQDEGHRNKMSVSQLRKRMREWLSTNYSAIILTDKDGPIAYALHRDLEKSKKR